MIKISFKRRNNQKIFHNDKEEGEREKRRRERYRAFIVLRRGVYLNNEHKSTNPRVTWKREAGEEGKKKAHGESEVQSRFALPTITTIVRPQKERPPGGDCILKRAFLIRIARGYLLIRI